MYLFERQNGWHCGVMGKATACDAGMPYVYVLAAPFQSSSLLMVWEKQQRMAQVFEPQPLT